MKTFLTGLGVLLLVVLPDRLFRSHPQPLDQSGWPRCPMCRGVVVAGAGSCPHCVFPLAPVSAEAVR